MLPKISVVIPVYNNANTIERAILSVLDQKYPNLELIVIDGGSSDGTVDVIKRYEKYISYWHSKRDGSCGLAINMGLEKATGIITSQLMADDWFEPGIFLKIGQAYLENPDVDVISCGGRFVKYDSETNEYSTILSYTKPKELDINLYNMCFGIPAMSSRFITKAYVNKIGLFIPFDAQGKHNFSADREYLIRAAVLGCKNIVIDHLGHSYFAHEGSATFGNSIKNKLKIFKEHLDLIKRYLQTYTLTKQQTAILNYWYTHQSVRLFYYEVARVKWREAWQISKEGVNLARTQWLIALFSAPCRIAISKGLPWIKEKIRYTHDK